MKHLISSLSLALLFILSYSACNTDIDKKNKVPDDQPRRIEMLFLGHDSEHHNSRAYYPILASALANQAINISYTEDVNELNADNLSKYDGVIIYANHEDRHPDQEKALMDYVSAGHAFIPIHCASFCFKESDAYIDLVGGQFNSHDTGTFVTTIINKDHPVMANLEAFSTWDETYVHHKMADDIEVLMERVEGDHHEPWTWVKDYGKGKVFYTAYGHDQRSWENPGFHQLIIAGILWAVDDNTKKNWAAFMTDMPSLEYRAEANIPNYEKRDPAPLFQLPLSPEQSAKLIQVPPGFELSLFAAEPDIINPIAMNWDERGRLWVIETVDYPNTVRDDKGEGDDLIKIIEDTDGDGRGDKVTIFADKLNIPTSFVFANGGIIVSQAPHFLFLKDTDGDDRADIKEILIEGWGTFDTHAGPSNLQNGVDNNIYGVLGYSGFEGTIFGKPYNFKQGVYRFDREYRNFEFLTSTSNNTWGLGFNEENDIFASTANNTHSVFLGIPNAYFEGATGLSAKGGSVKIDGHYDMQPITRNYRQVDVFGGFTAAAGHHFYTARTYPSSYWDQIAFVCEPTGGLVHQARIKKDGAGFNEVDAGNLFASSDEWVSPVEAKVGPDGNVWVADWYNFIVQHNPTPVVNFGGYNAENGKGNAYENPLRDKSKGRIWRILPKGQQAATLPTLSADDPSGLVKALSHDNMFWRMTAQRLLVERNQQDVTDDLIALVNNSKVDANGHNPSALHALWTLEGIGAVDLGTKAMAAVQGALTHPAAAIRRAAIQMMPHFEATDKAIKQAKLLNDPDPSVQLATLLYLSKSKSDEQLGNELFEMSKNDAIKKDRWLSRAVYIAASQHKEGFLKSYLNTNPTFQTKKISPYKPYENQYDDSEWATMKLPQFIETAGLQMDGTLWFRTTFDAPANAANATATLSLGSIDDTDIAYINGTQVGTTKAKYLEPRIYQVKKGILQPGKNIISIWVEDTGGGGGFTGKADQMFITIGDKKISLSGEWKYEIEKDYSGTGNIFDNTSIAELLYKNSATATAQLVDEESTSTAKKILIKTIQNQMKYDITNFTVKAGERVELTFENNDFMQHNLLLIDRGSVDRVGAAADKMAQQADGADKSYIPDMSEVIEATGLVDPKQKAVLTFTAPDTPGDYPYICTFPGHWRMMQGVMKVVK